MRVLQKLFISLFALYRDMAFVNATGALFQSLAVSLLKLILAAVDEASSFHCLMELGRIDLRQSALFGLLGSSLSGYDSMCVHFQASTSLISADS